MAERAAAVLTGSPATGTGRRGGADGHRERPPGSHRDRRRGGGPGRLRAGVRVPELVLGTMLVAGGALAAVLWATSEPSQRVLVASRPISRGETIDASMLRWAEIRGDPLAAATDPARVGGRIAVVDMAPGAPLVPSALREPTAVGADQVEVGLALDLGEYPVGLAVGDAVVVVVLAGPDELGAPAAPVTLDAAAEVLAAAAADGSGAEVVVNLLVHRADVELIAAADEVRLARLATPEAG